MRSDLAGDGLDAHTSVGPVSICISGSGVVWRRGQRTFPTVAAMLMLWFEE